MAPSTTYKSPLFFRPSSTGKELDEETGYGYFGARYMDHELMTGWLSVDPMADKYPSMSPYAYCAWNPIKLVDPDGAEIWINGFDGNEYQYKEGKLYTKGGEIYCGHDEFATRVQNDLNILKGYGMKEQVESLENSGNKHTIVFSVDNSINPDKIDEDNISNGVGCGTTIKYNPNRTEIGGWKRPAVVGLAHEAQHAFEMDKGKYDKTKVMCRSIAFCKFMDSGAKKMSINLPHADNIELFYRITTEKEIERGEYSAVQAANKVYSALGGMTPRTTYDGFSIKQLLK